MRFLTLAGPSVSAANLAVIDIAGLKEHRKMAAAAGPEDARLQAAVDYINRAAFEYTRRKWFIDTGTNWDLVLDGPVSGRPLTLPHTPVTVVASIERGYYDASGWVRDHLFASSEYHIDLETGLVTALPPEWFPTGQRSMRVIYRSGYATLPADAVWAYLAWASVEYERGTSNRHDQTSVAFETGSTSYTFDTLPTAAARVLRSYTRRDSIV